MRNLFHIPGCCAHTHSFLKAGKSNFFKIPGSSMTLLTTKPEELKPLIKFFLTLAVDVDVEEDAENTSGICHLHCHLQVRHVSSGFYFKS